MSIEKMAMIMFDSYVDGLRRKKRDFRVSSTSYTRMIKLEERTIMFANDFKDTSQFLLPLINKVRKDGARYLENNILPDHDDPIEYSSLLNNPLKPKTICKIDLNGAYWNYALKRGIISKETDDYCTKVHENRSYKELKSSRLKTLGSLATRKLTQFFEDGKENKKERKIKVENTRDLYIEVCRGIDCIMKECARCVEGCVYYYWDCMFVDKTFSQDAIDFFREQDFDTTVEETTLDFVTLGDIAYLVSKKDDKMYLVKREDKHLLYE
jgi:hypothetical protein